MFESNSSISFLEALAAGFGLDRHSSEDASSSPLFPQETTSKEILNKNSWLRPRLFEAVVGRTGLMQYAEDLTGYSGLNPERDVRINILLASLHLSTSLNPLILDIITTLSKTGKLKIDERQLAALSSVLKPRRDYMLNRNDLATDFDPLHLEDIRIQVQRATYDRMDSRTYGASRERLAEPRHGVSVPEEIPNDLIPLGVVGNLEINRVLSLSRKYSELRILVHSGFVVWKFSNHPTIFIKDGRAFYSPKETKLDSSDAIKQKNSIVKLLALGTGRNMCILCTERVGYEIVLLENGAVGLVCQKCEGDSRVLRMIPSVENERKES